jgi:hypothetical protein
MGKTTNNLLNAGDFALEGRVNVDALRTLHMATIEEFGFGGNVKVRAGRRAGAKRQLHTVQN